MPGVTSSRDFQTSQRWVIGLANNPTRQPLTSEQIEELRVVLRGTTSFQVETQAVLRGAVGALLEEIVWLRGDVSSLESALGRLVRGEGPP